MKRGALGGPRLSPAVSGALHTAPEEVFPSTLPDGAFCKWVLGTGGMFLAAVGIIPWPSNSSFLGTVGEPLAVTPLVTWQPPWTSIVRLNLGTRAWGSGFLKSHLGKWLPASLECSSRGFAHFLGTEEDTCKPLGDPAELFPLLWLGLGDVSGLLDSSVAPPHTQAWHGAGMEPAE